MNAVHAVGKLEVALDLASQVGEHGDDETGRAKREALLDGVLEILRTTIDGLKASHCPGCNGNHHK